MKNKYQVAFYRLKNDIERGNCDYNVEPYLNVIKELVDKETLMKVGKIQPVVLEEDIKNYGNSRFHLCPKCQRIVYPFHISDYSKIKYCPNCGQKLDWGVEGK